MSRTILLADDSVTIQKVIELTFMDEDYEVVAVGNGDDALEQLDEITPDFVIADVHMPGASGYDVAKHSKSLRPEVPVLLLVGTFEPFDEERAEKSGCDAFLKKPFDSQELQRLVEELSAEGQTGGEGPLEATGWQAQVPPSTSAPPPPPGSPENGSEPAAAEESSAEPFSLGSIDLEDEPAPTRVEPPSEPAPAPPGSGTGSAADSADAGGPAPLDALDETPVFDDLPEVDELEDLDEDEPGLAVGADVEELPTEPEPVEAAPPPAAPPAAPPPDPAASEEPPPAPAGSAAPLSDEDVDRIARRILELLGDAPIRDVAWEVVPDMAEVVIRSRLRELETQIESVE